MPPAAWEGPSPFSVPRLGATCSMGGSQRNLQQGCPSTWRRHVPIVIGGLSIMGLFVGLKPDELRSDTVAPFSSSEPVVAAAWGKEVTASALMLEEMPQTLPQTKLVEVPQTTPTDGGAPANKTLVLFLHFHASGGKALCEWAGRAHKDRQHSGVKLDGMQLLTPACNQVDPDPPEQWWSHNIHTCADMRRFCTHHSGSTFMFVETAMDVALPCPGLAIFTVMRQPWLRLQSTQGKLGWLFPNASAVLKRMRVGDHPLGLETGWRYCGFAHAPTCNPFFQAGYLDNFHIRFLLGSREGARIAWGMINETHLARAKAILESLDLVVPLEDIADALPALQCAVGDLYDVGLDGKPGGRYVWPMRRSEVKRSDAMCHYDDSHNRHERERKELCLLFNAQNRWDIELYDWVVARWRARQAGRCSGVLA